MRSVIARWNEISGRAWRNGSSDGLHEREKNEIKSKLANLVPKNFREVFKLFDFAAEAIMEKFYDLEKVQTEIKMLNALRRGISYAESEEWARPQWSASSRPKRRSPNSRRSAYDRGA